MNGDDVAPAPPCPADGPPPDARPPASSAQPGASPASSAPSDSGDSSASSAQAGALAPAAERFDDEGLPLDRAPTLDDVRGGAGSGRSVAIGCTILVTLLVLAFWLLRAVVMG